MLFSLPTFKKPQRHNFYAKTSWMITNYFNSKLHAPVLLQLLRSLENSCQSQFCWNDMLHKLAFYYNFNDIKESFFTSGFGSNEFIRAIYCSLSGFGWLNKSHIGIMLAFVWIKYLNRFCRTFAYNVQWQGNASFYQRFNWIQKLKMFWKSCGKNSCPHSSQ